MRRQPLTDDEYVIAVDAAYAAIEARGRAAGLTSDQIALANVLFTDGFNAALPTFVGVSDADPLS